MDIEILLRRFIEIPSVNVAMGGTGEQAMADAVKDVLVALGAQVVSVPVAQELAANIVGTFPGRPHGPTVLFLSHLDTVPQPATPIVVRREGGRLHGRGAADTKASAVAMLAAIEALLDDEAREATIVFAGVVDEESTMRGSAALLPQFGGVDAAIIGEPTGLVPIRVHNGLVRFRVRCRGVAAHTSQAHLGRSALVAAAHLVLALTEDLGPRLRGRGDPLAGPALVTPSVLHGGSAINVVPDTAEVFIDRRLAPSERPDDALAEIDELLDSLREAGHVYEREAPFVELPGLDTPADHPLVVAATAACARHLGRPVEAAGAPYGTDASRLQSQIPCVVLGPGSIEQAHTDDEWIELAEVDCCARVYADVVRSLVATGDAGS